MCGINGFNKHNKQALGAMNALVGHRGPDFAGSFFDDHMSIGHTLLSIRDAAARSHQPWVEASSPWVLAFNGQIYNTDQLKQELGIPSELESDTAVLYETIKKLGWNFIGKIQGMFAIALYHKEERVLRLYRDPSGQKLLYYYHKGGDFIFSSEIKGILSHSSVDRSIDEEAVLIAASLGYIPGKKTLLKFIKKLNLSETCTYSVNQNTLHVDTFASNAPEYYSGTMDDAFKLLIAEHLQSKDRVSINLSGGLDSSLILHEASKQGYDLISYTNFFEGAHEKYTRDAELARRLAKDYGTEHHEIRITKRDYLENFVESYATIEEPNYNISLPAYLITAKTEGIRGDGHRVVLSGDGGDEIFGGYPYYYQNKRMDLHERLLTPYLFNALKNWRNRTDYQFNDPSERWLFLKMFHRVFLSHNPDRKPVIAEYIKETMREFRDAYETHSHSVYRSMLHDRVLWLGGENFIRSDKLYMSQSLELRSPLSYHPFRQYIDSHLSQADYISKNQNKLFLRKHYEKKLPAYITARPDKSGWRSPVSDWYDAQTKELFLSIIDEAAHNGGLVDWKGVREHVETRDQWPGKQVHLYLSLAILSKQFGLNL